MQAVQKRGADMIVKRVSVPLGLEELMEGLAKEVLLKKPKDLYVFASEYFSRLVILRERNSNNKAYSIRTAQSVTHLQAPLSKDKKLLPSRPTRHISRQLSVRDKSPMTQPKPPRKASSNQNKSRGPISKHSSSKTSKDATPSSSLQSTPRDKNQRSSSKPAIDKKQLKKQADKSGMLDSAIRAAATNVREVSKIKDVKKSKDGLNLSSVNAKSSSNAVEDVKTTKIDLDSPVDAKRSSEEIGGVEKTSDDLVEAKGSSPNDAKRSSDVMEGVEKIHMIEDLKRTKDDLAKYIDAKRSSDVIEDVNKSKDDLVDSSSVDAKGSSDIIEDFKRTKDYLATYIDAKRSSDVIEDVNKAKGDLVEFSSVDAKGSSDVIENVKENKDDLDTYVDAKRSSNVIKDDKKGIVDLPSVDAKSSSDIIENIQRTRIDLDSKRSSDVIEDVNGAKDSLVDVPSVDAKDSSDVIEGVKAMTVDLDSSFDAKRSSNVIDVKNAADGLDLSSVAVKTSTGASKIEEDALEDSKDVLDVNRDVLDSTIIDVKDVLDLKEGEIKKTKNVLESFGASDIKETDILNSAIDAKGTSKMIEDMKKNKDVKGSSDVVEESKDALNSSVDVKGFSQLSQDVLNSSSVDVKEAEVKTAINSLGSSEDVTGSSYVTQATKDLSVITTDLMSEDLTPKGSSVVKQVVLDSSTDVKESSDVKERTIDVKVSSMENKPENINKAVKLVDEMSNATEAKLMERGDVVTSLIEEKVKAANVAAETKVLIEEGKGSCVESVQGPKEVLDDNKINEESEVVTHLSNEALNQPVEGNATAESSLKDDIHKSSTKRFEKGFCGTEALNAESAGSSEATKEEVVNDDDFIDVQSATSAFIDAERAISASHKAVDIKMESMGSSDDMLTVSVAKEQPANAHSSKLKADPNEKRPFFRENQEMGSKEDSSKVEKVIGGGIDTPVKHFLSTFVHSEQQHVFKAGAKDNLKVAVESGDDVVATEHSSSVEKGVDKDNSLVFNSVKDLLEYTSQEANEDDKSSDSSKNLRLVIVENGGSSASEQTSRNKRSATSEDVDVSSAFDEVPGDANERDSKENDESQASAGTIESSEELLKDGSNNDNQDSKDVDFKGHLNEQPSSLESIGISKESTFVKEDSHSEVAKRNPKIGEIEQVASVIEVVKNIFGDPGQPEGKSIRQVGKYLDNFIQCEQKNVFVGDRKQSKESKLLMSKSKRERPLSQTNLPKSVSSKVKVRRARSVGMIKTDVEFRSKIPRKSAGRRPLVRQLEANSKELADKLDSKAKEDALIAKKILTGVEGAEKHIKLIQQHLKSEESQKIENVQKEDGGKLHGGVEDAIDENAAVILLDKEDLGEDIGNAMNKKSNNPKQDNVAAVKIQSAWKGFITRKLLKKDENKEEAVKKIQAVVRGFLDRLRYEKMKLSNDVRLQKQPLESTLKEVEATKTIALDSESKGLHSNIDDTKTESVQLQAKKEAAIRSTQIPSATSEETIKHPDVISLPNEGDAATSIEDGTEESNENNIGDTEEKAVVEQSMKIKPEDPTESLQQSSKKSETSMQLEQNDLEATQTVDSELKEDLPLKSVEDQSEAPNSEEAAIVLHQPEESKDQLLPKQKIEAVTQDQVTSLDSASKASTMDYTEQEPMRLQSTALNSAEKSRKDFPKPTSASSELKTSQKHVGLEPQSSKSVKEVSSLAGPIIVEPEPEESKSAATTTSTSPGHVEFEPKSSNFATEESSTAEPSMVFHQSLKKSKEAFEKATSTSIKLKISPEHVELEEPKSSNSILEQSSVAEAEKSLPAATSTSLGLETSQKHVELEPKSSVIEPAVVFHQNLKEPVESKEGLPIATDTPIEFTDSPESVKLEPKSSNFATKQSSITEAAEGSHQTFREPEESKEGFKSSNFDAEQSSLAKLAEVSHEPEESKEGFTASKSTSIELKSSPGHVELEPKSSHSATDQSSPAEAAEVSQQILKESKEDLPTSTSTFVEFNISPKLVKFEPKSLNPAAGQSSAAVVSHELKESNKGFPASTSTSIELKSSPGHVELEPKSSDSATEQSFATEASDVSQQSLKGREESKEGLSAPTSTSMEFKTSLEHVELKPRSSNSAAEQSSSVEPAEVSHEAERSKEGFPASSTSIRSKSSPEHVELELKSSDSATEPFTPAEAAEVTQQNLECEESQEDLRTSTGTSPKPVKLEPKSSNSAAKQSSAAKPAELSYELEESNKGFPASTSTSIELKSSPEHMELEPKSSDSATEQSSATEAADVSQQSLKEREESKEGLSASTSTSMEFKISPEHVEIEPKSSNSAAEKSPSVELAKISHEPEKSEEGFPVSTSISKELKSSPGHVDLKPKSSDSTTEQYLPTKAARQSLKEPEESKDGLSTSTSTSMEFKSSSKHVELEPKSLNSAAAQSSSAEVSHEPEKSKEGFLTSKSTSMKFKTSPGHVELEPKPSNFVEKQSSTPEAVELSHQSLKDLESGLSASKESKTSPQHVELEPTSSISAQELYSTAEPSMMFHQTLKELAESKGDTCTELKPHEHEEIQPNSAKTSLNDLKVGQQAETSKDVLQLQPKPPSYVVEDASTVQAEEAFTNSASSNDRQASKEDIELQSKSLHKITDTREELIHLEPDMAKDNLKSEEKVLVSIGAARIAKHDYKRTNASTKEESADAKQTDEVKIANNRSEDGKSVEIVNGHANEIKANSKEIVDDHHAPEVDGKGVEAPESSKPNAADNVETTGLYGGKILDGLLAAKGDEAKQGRHEVLAISQHESLAEEADKTETSKDHRTTVAAVNEENANKVESKDISSTKDGSLSEEVLSSKGDVKHESEAKIFEITTTDGKLSKIDDKLEPSSQGNMLKATSKEESSESEHSNSDCNHEVDNAKDVANAAKIDSKPAALTDDKGAKPSFYRTNTVVEPECLKKDVSHLQDDTDHDANNNTSKEETLLEKEVRRAVQDIVASDKKLTITPLEKEIEQTVRNIMANNVEDKTIDVDEALKQLPNVPSEEVDSNHAATDDVSSISSADSVVTVIVKPKTSEHQQKQPLAKSLSTSALEDRVELLDQVQNSLLDQLSGKTTSNKFDIEQLRKELHDKHQDDHDQELMDYLYDFEPPEDDGRQTRTPIRDLPDIAEEGESKDESDKETDHHKTSSEIIINNDNIVKINRDGPKLLHTSELHDLVMPAKKPDLASTDSLKHTSEFHDTVVVPLPSGANVKIKNASSSVQTQEDTNQVHMEDNGNQTTIHPPPAGVAAVTSSPRQKETWRSDDGVVVAATAQAPLKDDTASPRSVGAEHRQHQSPSTTRFAIERAMETSENDNNNKRNNAISARVSAAEKNMEAQAATKIQAGFRGYQVRKQLKTKTGATGQKRQLRKRSSRDNMKEGDLEEKSAVKIQAGVRGFLVRRRQKKQVNASPSA